MSKLTTRPNILLIMVDQMRFPRFGYGEEHGFVTPLKQIFGFQGSPEDSNPYRRFFPGLWALRDNAVVFRNHRVAATACVPSRAVIFSGQYGTVTGVTQTNGLFKDGSDPAFPWLDPHRFPTVADWLTTNGYSCHYFGKWHVSGEATTSLREFGFADWELSYPDPHGSAPNNLGFYRDHQFRDLVTAFLRRQGLGAPYAAAHAAHRAAQASNHATLPDEPQQEAAPWFAVTSFTNPHDIGVYPIGPRFLYNSPVAKAPYALKLPPQGSKGNRPPTGTMAVPLNSIGFPQDNANLPPTWNESLDNKPSCQLDNVYKMGLAFASAVGWLMNKENPGPGPRRAQLERAVNIALATNMIGNPLALTPDPELACRAFMQYYAYLVHEVDQHIDAVLRALDESGQADNTIVIFTSDHGEYGGAHHLMTQKFHSAYEECIHVPMVIRFPASMHQVPGGLQQVDNPTSHADMLPSILGLAGIRGDDVRKTRDMLRQTHEKTYMPVGADLGQFILSGESTVTEMATGDEREGVLFMTHDMITVPLGGEASAVSDAEDESRPLTRYEVFVEAIERIRAGGTRFPEESAKLEPGPIRQPCLVHSVITRDHWKLVRYFAPETVQDVPEQYELYDLKADPSEQYNLLVFDGAFPTPVDLDTLPVSQRHPDVDIADKARTVMALLTALERRLLTAPEADTEPEAQEAAGLGSS